MSLSLHHDSVKSAQKDFSILVVEDDPLTLEMMNLLLTDYGYHVVKAAGYEEALQISDKESLDLVISDIGLPDGCALTLMRTLKERYGIPGISVSGFMRDSNMLEAGFVEHVTKPVEFSNLVDLIEKLRRLYAHEKEARILPNV